MARAQAVFSDNVFDTTCLNYSYANCQSIQLYEKSSLRQQYVTFVLNILYLLCLEFYIHGSLIIFFPD